MSKGLQLLVWWPSRIQSERDNAEGKVTRLRCEVVNAQGRIVSHQECLPQELPANLPATVLLHSDDVSLLPVNVPEQKNKKFGEALAYATEPLVLGDIEDLFVSAHGQLRNRGEGNWRTVACVERLRIRSILVAASGMGLDVRKVSCEPLMFDIRGRDVWLIDTGAGAWVCSSIDPPWLLGADELNQGASRLTWWLSQNRPEDTGPLLLISRTPSMRSQWESATGRSVEVLGRDAMVPALDSTGLVPERDLRAGGTRRQTIDSRWQTPVRLAVAAMALGLIVLNVAAQRVRNADRAIDAAVEAAFAKAMPNTPMIADPLIMLERARQQMAQTGQTGSSPFTRLLHAGSLQMQSLPFNAASTIQFDGTTLQMSFAQEVSETQRREIENNLRGQQIRGQWQTDERKRNRISLTWVRN